MSTLTPVLYVQKKLQNQLISILLSILFLIVRMRLYATLCVLVVLIKIIFTFLGYHYSMQPPSEAINFWHLTFTSLQALLIISGSSISTCCLILSLSWSMVSGLGENTLDFKPQQKKSKGLQSGDLAGQSLPLQESIAINLSIYLSIYLLAKSNHIKIFQLSITIL